MLDAMSGERDHVEGSTAAPIEGGQAPLSKRRRWYAGFIALWLHFRDAEPDRLVAYGTFVLAIATIVLALVAHSTDEKVSRQIALLERDQRAWVFSTRARAVSPLDINANDAAIVIEHDLKNSGKTPARRALVDGILTSRDTTWPIAEYRAAWEICDNLRRGHPSVELAGNVVFPGDIVPQRTTFRLQGPLFEGFKAGQRPVLMIVGCVDYQSGDRPEHHQHRFVYEIDRTVAGENKLIDPKIASSVPANELAIMINPFLAGDAD
jgi:hypothetical protein